MKPRSLGLVAIAVLALGSSAVSLAQTAPGPAVTPPPPPAPNTNATLGPVFGTPGPTPLPSAAPVPTSPPSAGAKRGGRPAGRTATPDPNATDTPEPPQFQTMDGVWELQMQPLDGSRTKYSHLFVTQKGSDLSGTWKRDDMKTALPFTGTFDGRLFKLNLTGGPAAQTLSGYAENFGDMVGLWNDGDPKHDGVPFTASHRKKERLAH